MQAYERFAELLRDSLGLEPTPETRALLDAVRGVEPQPETAPPQAPAAAPPQAPAAAAGAGSGWSWPRELPFVGRDGELDRLHAAWQAGLALVIEGPAGIGKTRLAIELVAARGAFALAACRPGDAREPYAAFVRALRVVAGTALDAIDWPPHLRDQLMHLVPELGVPPVGIDSEAARARLLDACIEAWRWLTDEAFDAVIVDDAHLADATSRALFARIVRQRRAGTRPGALEVFVRRAQTRAVPDADTEGLLRDGCAMALPVRALEEDGTHALAQALLSSPPPPTLAPQLRAASAGNAFAMLETLRHWIGLSVLRVDGGGRWTMSQASGSSGASSGAGDVAALVRARANALSGDARRLLESAALAREPFTAGHVGAACALDEVQALQAVDAALQAQLLRESGDGFAFMHDLVRSAIVDGIGADRQRLLHRQLALAAEQLRTHTPRDRAPSSASIAEHWELGGEPARAVPHRLAAAKAALAVFEDAAAEAHWAQASIDGAGLAERVAIAGGRASMRRNRDDEPGLEQSVAELDALADEAGQHPDTAPMALRARIEAADVLSMMRRSAEALARIDEVLQLLAAAAAADPAGAADDASQRRLALAWLVRSQALNGLGRGAESIRAAEQALACGALTVAQQGRALHALVYGHFVRNELADARSCAERSLALWQSVGERRLMARAHGNLALVASLIGRRADARLHYDSAINLAREMHMPQLLREQLTNRAYEDLHDGLVAEASASLAEAMDVTASFADPTHRVFILGMQVHAGMQRGDLGAAVAMAREGQRCAMATEIVTVRADLASMALDLTIELDDRAWADALLALLPADVQAIPDNLRLKLALNRARLALARGELDAAGRVLEEAGPIDAMAQPYDRGYAALAHAQRALATGELAQALSLLDRWQPEATHVDARARMQALRVQAWACRLADAPAADPASVAAADEAFVQGLALRDDERTPAPAALALGAALAALASARGDAATAARLQAQLSERVASLAAGLADASHRRGFSARWRTGLQR